MASFGALTCSGSCSASYTARLSSKPCLPLSSRPLCYTQARNSRSHRLVVRADSRDNGGNFMTGFVLGGAIFGTLGYLFAPQISAALLTDDMRLKYPKLQNSPPKTKEQVRQEIIDKIKELNEEMDNSLDAAAMAHVQPAAPEVPTYEAEEAAPQTA